MYKLSREELKEVAADLLQCSMEQIRTRTKFCYKGAKIEENETKIFFALCRWWLQYATAVQR